MERKEEAELRVGRSEETQERRRGLAGDKNQEAMESDINLSKG